MINHQQITYGDGLSLSEASVCSSMDIRTPDIHPVYNGNRSVIQSEMVGQIISSNTSFGDQLVSPTTATIPTQHWNQYQDPSMVWTSTTDTSNEMMVSPSIALNYPHSINSEENDESSSNSCPSEIEEKVRLFITLLTLNIQYQQKLKSIIR